MKSKLPETKTVLAAGLLLVAPVLHAETKVFVTYGEQGETIFSDIASSEARVVAYQTPESPVADSQAQIELMLSVAESLASARREREAERAHRRGRASSTATTQAPEPEPRYRPYAGANYWHHNRPWRHHRPHQKPVKDVSEPEQPPSRSYRFKPKL